MSSDWPMTRIDEIKASSKNAITIGPFGSRMKSDCYVDSGVPVIRGTNFGPNATFIKNFVYISEQKADELKSCNVYKDDLVFPHRGSIGEVAIVSDQSRYVISSSLMKLTCNKEKVAPKFLYYFFKSQTGRHELLKNSSQVGTPGIGQPLTSLKSIELRLPPLKVQESIARVLSHLDDKIRLNQQINQTLEQMAQAIFKSWFVDFEPVKAKMAALEAGGSEEDALIAAMQAISGKDQTQLARFKTEQPEQYNELRTTAELFPAAMQDSELGEIPKGWSLSQIGDEAIVVGGGTPSTKDPAFWENGHIHWSSPKDMSNLPDKVLTYTERRITEAGLAKISSGLLPVNTVLMSSRAPVGYLALAKVPVAINQGYIALKCEKALSPEFILQWCGANMDEIKSRASGTTFAEISKKNFKIIPVVVPSEHIVGEYSKRARQIYSQIENNVKETRSLTNIRDTLLPKLLSGSLSIASTEAASK